MTKKILVVMVMAIVGVMALTGCSRPYMDTYSIPMIDLEEGVIRAGNVGDNEILYTFSDAEKDEYSEMFRHKTIVADKDDFGKDYMAHPDSILLKRKKAGTDKFEFGNEILTMFPLAHGKGELKAKVSYDGGLTYDKANTLEGLPKSFKRSQETPTLYRLTFTSDNVPSDDDKLIMLSGNPKWPGDLSYKANGFNASLSSPSVDANGDTVEGRVWTEFETWYGHDNDKDNGDDFNIREPQGKYAFDCIVAMSSLTRLKDPTTHEWKNAWMGLFHDHNFDCYKTILTFEDDAHTIMKWSKPVKYFDAYKDVEHKSSMCEVECIRSEAGMGDTLVLLTRSNSKKLNSLISFSNDEGATWSEPKEAPMSLNGERHKAEWVKVNGEDKLFVTFRSIDRGTDKYNKFGYGMRGWMSEGYVAWVGDWQDLVDGTEGDFRVKLAHTYLDKQTAPSRDANGDTGYCGNVVLPNGKVATCSYGRFAPENDETHGKHTYIVGKVIDVAKLYELVKLR